MTVTASNYARQKNELYQTEPWAARALIKHLPNLDGKTVWEPAAGFHLMADVFRETGATVITSDIETTIARTIFFSTFSARGLAPGSRSRKGFPIFRRSSPPIRHTGRETTSP